MTRVHYCLSFHLIPPGHCIRSYAFSVASLNHGKYGSRQRRLVGFGTIRKSKENNFFNKFVYNKKLSANENLDLAPETKKFLEIFKNSNDQFSNIRHNSEIRKMAEVIESLPIEDNFAILAAMATCADDKLENALTRLLQPLDNAISKWFTIHCDLNEDVLTKAIEAMNVFCYYDLDLRAKLSHLLRQNLMKNIEKLDKETFKYLLFLLSLTRSPIYPNEHIKLEEKLTKLVDDMSLEEVSIFAAAFFKTQTKINDPQLISKIVEKLKDVSPDNEIAAASIFKCLRYSVNHDHGDDVRVFIKTIDPKFFESVSIPTIVHFNRMSSEYLIQNPLALKSLLEKCCSDGSDARMKDLTLALRTAGDFNIRVSDEILEKMISMMRKNQDQMLNPKFIHHFLGFIIALISYEKYPHDLIELALQKKDLRDVKASITKKGEIDKLHQWLHLNSLLSIEHPEKYTEKVLTRRELLELTSLIQYAQPLKTLKTDAHVNSFEYSFTHLWRGARYAFGGNHVYVTEILPESTFPELIIFQGADWPEKLQENRFCLKPNKYEGLLLVTLQHRSHFADVHNIHLKNHYLTKARLLRKLGFKSIDIHWMNVAAEGMEVIAGKITNKVMELGDKKFIDLLQIDKIK